MARQLRVILGKHRGKKTRLRYPSQMGGYIQYTFSSKRDAEEHIKGLSRWAQKRARLTEV